jgi:hypothetical protein
MKHKKVNNYWENITTLTAVLGIILLTPTLLFLKKTVMSAGIVLLIIICGGIFGFIFNSAKVNSLKTFKDAVFINLIAWGSLCSFLFIGTNYYFSTKSIRQHTFPISNRYLTHGKNAAAIVEVANTNFDYSFKFKTYEMEDVNQADSIAITFREGIFGYIVIRDYHLISNP